MNNSEVIHGWETLQLGPFDTCYTLAKQRGYDVIGRVHKGLKLHVPNSSDWATLTTASHGYSCPTWELVKYDHDPNLDDPIFFD